MRKVYVIEANMPYGSDGWRDADDGRTHDTEAQAEARVTELLERFPKDLLGGDGPRYRIQPEYRP